MKLSHVRLLKFMEDRGLSQADLARELRCSRTFTSMLCHGEKVPGRRIANLIEGMTRDWVGGPIRSETWDDSDVDLGTTASNKKRAA